MQKVIVVSKTHLDLGFTDYAEHIYHKYLDEFIPNAVSIANELNADGSKRFVWTTGSWLLKEALKNGSEQNRQALLHVLDYTNVSRRWSMPGRYYTKVFEKKGTAIRFVMIDTAPLIDKYRNESETYPDACKQDMDQQLAWIDSVLTVAKEDWVVVIGHHPIYAETSKDDSERSDMQKRLDPILRKHKVDIYACGHIHNFQHLRVPGSDIDYVVNSAGSLSRKVKPVEGTLFCSPEPGFSIFTADKKELDMHMIDKKGKVIYTVKRTK